MIKKLYFVSLIIITVSFISVFITIYKILTGIALYTDLILISISISINLLLLTMPYKYWRIGLLFVLASAVLKNSSKLIYEQSLSSALVMNVVSVILLVPALYYFQKMKHWNETPTDEQQRRLG